MSVRDSVVEMRLGDLGLSMAQIARSVDVTRERVRQILKDESLPTRRICISGNHCVHCCRRLSHPRRGDKCKLCNMALRRVSLICSTCGISFIRKRSESYDRHANDDRYANKGNFYCSLHCFHARNR